MIPYIEDEISKILHAGIERYAGNPELIASVLRVGEEKANKLSTILKNKTPVIKRGYPRHPTELPCICILLSGEEESQSGLGDYNDEPLSTIEVRETITVPISIEDGFLILNVDKVPITRIHEVYDPSTEEEITKYRILDHKKGKIQILDITNLWEGKPLMMSFSHRNTIETFIESKYEMNYRVEVWTNNGDFTVELYHIIKALLLQGRSHLINHGLVKQRLKGTDFQPVPSFFPEFVYRRGVSLSGEALISIPDIDNFDHIISNIIVEPDYGED